MQLTYSSARKNVKICYTVDKSISTSPISTSRMLTAIHNKDRSVQWFHITHATPEHIAEASAAMELHPFITRALCTPVLRSMVEEYENTLYLVLQFPFFNDDRSVIIQHEVDIVIQKHRLLTVTYTPLPLLDAMTEALKNEVQRNDLGEHAGFLLFELLHRLYGASLKQLETVGQDIVEIENNIFNGQEREMVRFISLVRREMIDFLRGFDAHEDVLVVLESAGETLFGKKFSPYLSGITGEREKLGRLIENNRELIEAVQQTNDSLLTTRMSTITKNLTIMAFVTFPLMLFSSLFGMNTRFLPIVGHAYDFWIIIGIMLFGTIGMFFFFKFKRWL
jgi:magnesium transporter